MARGGQRNPKRPAATSGPGNLSQRTDGPNGIKVPPAQFHGQRKQLEDQVQQGGQGAPPPGPDGLPQMPADPRLAQLFQTGIVDTPTGRPREPVTAGSPFGPGAGPPSRSGRLTIEVALAEAYRRSGSEHILRMMDSLR